MTNDKELVEKIEETIMSHNFYEEGISSLAPKLASLCRQHEWIPVSERLPDDGVNVLAGDKDGYGVYAYCYMGEGWAWCNSYGDIHGDPQLDDDYADRITHWMPLPEPPKEESDV